MIPYKLKNKSNKLDRNVLFIILEGIAAAIILNLFTPFTQAFVRCLGGKDLHVALINSLPQLVSIIVLIPCSMYIERIHNKKLATCMLIFVNGLFYAAISLMPYLPHEVRLLAYVALIGVMNWPGSLYTTTWQSFFSYTFDEKKAGRVYSLRSKYSALFGLITVLVTGYLLSYAPHNKTQRIMAYQAFYAACFAITILQVLFLYKVKQVSSKDTKNDYGVRSDDFGKLQTFKEILANRPFMIFCGCAFAFYLSWQIGWPLFFLYNVDIVKANEFQLGMINVAGGLTSVLSYSMWNRLSERKGNSFVLIIGALGLAVNPFFYTAPFNFYSILIINAVVGVSAAGFTLSLFCSLLETLPENKKTVYISFYNSILNISGFISPFIGIWLKSHVGIFVAFFIIGMLRLLAVILLYLRRMGEKRIDYEKTCNRYAHG